MANNKFVHQSVYNISVNRDRIIEIACNEELSKKDYKVFLMLLSQLTGYKEPEKISLANPDPLNFKKIDKSQIADALDMKKKDVEASIENLFDFGYLEEGDNDTVTGGYRFTF